MTSDWEPHKHVLRSLYLVRDMKLQDVMSYMEEHHGVKKSRRQYEGIFKRWGFRKHAKSDDWKIVHRKMDSRRRRGKSTEVYRDGRLVPESTLRKESRHDNRTLLDGYGPSAPSPRTPPGFHICTPAVSGSTFIMTQNLPTVRFIGDLFSDVPARGIFGDFGGASRVEEVLEHKLDDDIDNQDQVGLPVLDSGTAPQGLPDLDLEASTQLISSLWAAECTTYASQFDSLNRFSKFVLEAIFKITNDLVYDDMSDAIREFFRQGGRGLLKSFLATASPVARALARFALEEAIESSDLELATMVLRAGRDPDMRIKYGICVPLHLAAEACDEKMIQLLLSYGADPNLRCGDDTCELPLMRAVHKMNLYAVQILLRHGADVNAHGTSLRRGKSALRIAVEASPLFSAGPELLESLLEAGAYVNEIYHGVTALHAACECSDDETVKILLRYGADVHAGIPGYASPVEVAARRGHREVVRILIDHGAFWPVNIELSNAARRGEKQLMQALFESGANANCTSEFTRLHSALHEAAEAGHTSIVEWLINLGADVNAVSGSSDRGTALQVAALEGHLDIVRLLIERGANVNSPPCGERGHTALQAALGTRQKSIVMLLLEHGADVNAPPGGRFGTALHAAFSSQGRHVKPSALALEFAEILIVNHGAEVNIAAFGIEQTSVLELATWQQNLAAVQFLLHHGADASNGKALRQIISCWQSWESDAVGRAIIELLLAAGAPIGALCSSDISFPERRRFGDPIFMKMIQVLLDAGLDVNLPITPSKDDQVGLWHGPWNFNLLQSAIHHGHQPMIDYLLERGADVNAPACINFGRTALQVAALRSGLGLVEELLERGALINAEPAIWFGKTALQAAAAAKRNDIIPLLLERGADVNAPACFRDGRTALQAAVDCPIEVECPNHFDIIRLLLEQGADVNAEPAHVGGVTALQAAVISGSVETVILLLEKGADVNAPAAEVGGFTALEAAAVHGRLDIAQILLNVGAEIGGTRVIELATEVGHDGIIALMESQRDCTAV